jgi:methylglutaconyl-CoA hydratase
LTAIAEAMDYRKAYESYARDYAAAALRALNEALPEGYAIKWDFESLDSPREYNFSTDRLFVTLPLGHLETLREYAGDDALREVIEHRFTSRDGFISSYSNNLDDWKAKPLAEYDHNEAGAVLQAATMKAVPSFEDVVTLDYLNHQSPNAGDDAVEAGMAFDRAVELARIIDEKGPIALRAAKEAIDMGSEVNIEQGLEIEKACYDKVIYTADRKEGLKAFVEKRKPDYIGK